MKIKQKLNNYTEKYKENKEWEILETSHYIFHYNKNSEAEDEIDLISETQEKAHNKITNILQISECTEKIKYYLYSSEDQKEECMGDDGNAQAIWHDFSIHIVYSGKVKPLGEHEDTHLLTLNWGLANGFFQEGLAEYMNGCTWKDSETGKYIPSLPFVKKAYDQNINDKLENFFEHKFWNETMGDKWWYYYPLSGLFSKFLFENFGLEKYKEFYMSIDRNKTKDEVVAVFENIFGDLNNIKNEFEIENDLR